MNVQTPEVVAHVLLRSASGERPGDTVPITSDTLEGLRPTQGVLDDVARHFVEHGFDVAPVAPLMVTISGPATRFDNHFGIELVRGEDGAYTIGPSGGANGAELPLTKLPPGVRSLVAAIALEVPMTLDL